MGGNKFVLLSAYHEDGHINPRFQQKELTKKNLSSNMKVSFCKHPIDHYVIDVSICWRLFAFLEVNTLCENDHYPPGNHQPSHLLKLSYSL